MLTFCLLNLILTKKIVSGYEIKTTNILGLFKLKETHYYFSCGTILPEHEIGYIEQKIVDLIRANPGLMHQKLIGKLVKQWHNRDFYLNMGKYIIVNVLNHQKLNFFETNKTYCFPSVHINIDISPQFDPKPLEEITKAIMCELDQNPILSKLNLDLNKFFKTTIWSESGDWFCEVLHLGLWLTPCSVYGRETEIRYYSKSWFIIHL